MRIREDDTPPTFGTGPWVVARAVLLSLTVSAVSWAGAAGQERPPTGDPPCEQWVTIPGAGGRDRALARCALDRPPIMVGGEPALPGPRWATGLNTSVVLVVDPEGHAEPHWAVPGVFWREEGLQEELTEAIRRWRFRPGEAAGLPVRSAIPMRILTDVRVDTLPSRLTWSHRSHPVEDTLRGTWQLLDPLPPFSPEEEDAIYLSAIRLLMRQRVIRSNESAGHCLLLPEPGDPIRRAGLVELLEPVLHPWGEPGFDPRPGARMAGPGCEREPGPLRLVLPRVHRTEGDRAVLYLAGDHLPEWPPSFQGRRWRAWEARCIAAEGLYPEVEGTGPPVRCQVTPHRSGERQSEAGLVDHNPFGLSRRPGEVLHAAAVVTTHGALQRDTLVAPVDDIPRIAERGILDEPRRWCVRASSWLAVSVEPGDSVHVVIAPFRALSAGEDVRVTRVGPDEDVTRFPGTPCPSGGTEERRMGFFLLGGLGEPGKAPITVCVEAAGCERQYILDPGRHTLLPAPHLSFRASELRAGSRAGSSLVLRVFLDRDVEGLIPLVVARFEGLSMARFARPLGPREFEFDAGRVPEDPDSYHVYLVRVD